MPRLLWRKLTLRTNAHVDLKTALALWIRIKNTDIPVLNQQLTSSGLLSLKLDLPQQLQEGGEGEELRFKIDLPK